MGTAMNQGHDADFLRQMQSIGQLVRDLEQVGDLQVRTQVQQLTQLLLDLHAGGLQRLLELVSARGEVGRQIVEDCVADPLLRNLLLLHGLHPIDVEQRVQQALARVRPQLQSHGGDVELLAIAPHAVRLRLNGSCHGCAGSAATLKGLIEQAICELAPDIETIEVEAAVGAQPEKSSKIFSLPILS